ncbi:MAG: bifunctional folylpolyglutamate synthase/dihydrofolate synthase [Candidatus Omnitrophica bacterium]|nr:bifunctional folylpolyglutamate synthase/dihydrofolate synthase [Candidatus Omnitrophota bacterium]
MAGTKGKGSVANFVSYILANSGYQVGVYTSPHFQDFRERIKVVKNNICELIPKKDVIKIVEEFKPYLDKLRYTKRWGKISFFEVYTAIALKYFCQQNLDFVGVEVGLGGRLDATNVVKPLISVITHIGYDHTDKLGKTLKEIAYEKSGIIKTNVPVVTTTQRKEALKTILRRAKIKRSPLYILGKDFFFRNAKIKKDYTVFDFIFEDLILNGLKIYLKGAHQIENASLAIASLHILQKRKIIENKLNFHQGVKKTFLPGRFEIVKEKPLIILDVAHNLSSFVALKNSLGTYFPSKKIILVFAASKDKDIKRMLKTIPYNRIIVTKFNNPRAFLPKEIKRICNLKDAILTDNIKEALNKALSYYNQDNLILITGSFFIVAEVKQLIKSNDRY